MPPPRPTVRIRIVVAPGPRSARGRPICSPAAKASDMKISARNQIPGKITAVRTGSIMAEVEVAIDPAHITAAITRGSVEHLQLKEGDEVIVVIKSTEVMVGKE
jgi:molybdopterin-binding protein